MSQFVKCARCEYGVNCSLKDIAPELTGCEGHGKLHHRFEEKKKQLNLEAEEKRKQAIIDSEKSLQDFQPGDKVHLVGSTISMGLSIPRYLESGTLTVVGISKRAGKVKCDWDGGKPFLIPPLALQKIVVNEEKVHEG